MLCVMCLHIIRKLYITRIVDRTKQQYIDRHMPRMIDSIDRLNNYYSCLFFCSQWLITCKENKWMLSLIGTMHFAGIVVGSALAGALADW